MKSDRNAKNPKIQFLKIKQASKELIIFLATWESSLLLR